MKQNTKQSKDDFVNKDLTNIIDDDNNSVN